MSLRTRLFLLVGGLAAVLVVAQWWLVRSLSRDVSSEVGDVAFRVGEGVVTSLGMVERSPLPGSAPAPAPAAAPYGLARRFEMPPAPAQPAARSVVEREIVIREIDGRLQVVSQHVKVGSTDGTIVSTEDIASDGGAAADRFVTLSVDTAHDAGFLKVHGPSIERRVPIPRGGLDDALDAFRRRLLAGSAALLLGGIVVAAAIAHRATAPLRELRDAARAVGDGALGTQVPHAGAGEVGSAVAAFNRMSHRLAELDADARRLREREHLTEIGEIARGLAHGLRNPLNALGLTVDELAQGPAERARAPLAESAKRQIRRIDQSVRSFLALAASATKAPDEDVDVAGLVQDVALEALQDARGRVGVGVDAPDAGARVRGVPAELRAVVQALVVNAVEASPDGGRVRARVEPGERGSVRIVIEDDGPGIAKSVRARLFTPHVTTKASGSGMGLYLAHRIVAARGGTLELTPRDPRGTRAMVELPA